MSQEVPTEQMRLTLSFLGNVESETRIGDGSILAHPDPGILHSYSKSRALGLCRDFTV
jgi:hypothetical protein